MKNLNSKTVIIGLTGGIGSGKTLVAQILSRLGAYIIDTDVVSAAVTASGTECYARLCAEFKDCVVDGVLQRPLLKKAVFSDESLLIKLNSITHPYIISATLAEAAGRDIVAIQVPLLFESGFDKLCDTCVCVLSENAVREDRVGRRDGMNIDLIRAIMAAQLSNNQLAARCEFAIENNGSVKELEKRVEQVFAKIKAKYGGNIG